jgi:O-antigen/teichoic acid export membrane protein
MVRRFFRDSALYGVATVLSKGLTVLMVPVYTAFMSRSQIGLLELLLGGIAVLSLIVGLDISNALALEYGRAKEAEERKRYSSTALWFSVAAFGIALAVFWCTAETVATGVVGDPQAAAAIRAGAVSMAVSGVYLVTGQQLRWMMQPGKFGIVSFSFTLISLCATVFFAGPCGMGVPGVLYGTAAGAAAGLVLSLCFSRGEFSLTFDRPALRRMLVFCVPLVPSSLAAVVSQYISRFAIEAELGRESVGVYGVAGRLAGLAGLMMLGFGSALTPLVYAGQDDPATPRNLARIFRMFVSLASFGLAGLILFTPEVMAVLTRSDYTASAPLIAWLAPSVLLVQMYIFAPGPWISRRTWWVAAINAATALAALVLNWILVPRMGLTGAAVATLASAALHFTLSMAVSQHFYPVPHQWRILAAVAAAGAAVILLASLLPARISAPVILLKMAVLAGLAGLLIMGGGIEREIAAKCRVKVRAWLRRGNSRVP